MTLPSKTRLRATILILMFSIIPLGHAARWDKKTNLTVNETIEVPGATLTPGEYVVKLVDSDSNRHIVRFFNKDETEVLTTVIAIPNQRLQPTGDTTFTFYETPSGQAPALRAWFYPGDNFGQEFAYPQGRAQSLAEATNLHVPSVADDTEAAMQQSAADAPVVLRETEIIAVDPSQRESDLEAAATKNEEIDRRNPPTSRTAPVRATVEEEEPTTLAQAQPPAARPAPQREPETTTDPQSERLPDTASPAPLLGLIGLGSFVAAIGLRRISRLSR